MKIKVTRTIVMEGEEKWVREALEDCRLNPYTTFGDGSNVIRELARKEEKVEEEKF